MLMYKFKNKSFLEKIKNFPNGWGSKIIYLSRNIPQKGGRLVTFAQKIQIISLKVFP